MEIRIPSLIIEKNAINSIPPLVDFSSNCLLVTGEKSYEIAGKKVESLLIEKGHRTAKVFIKSASEEELKKALKETQRIKADVSIGIGGGKNIDIAKAISFKLKIPFISVPTIPSHDGIASNRAIISRGKEKYPLIGNLPKAVVADLDILTKAPLRYFSAGCGDVIAKKTAVLDWKLAREEKEEEFDEFIADLCMMCADLIIKNSERFQENFEDSVKLLIKTLITCGISMAAVNSSRPCSGSEHAFCHALDYLYPENKALHGEKVALGTYIMSYLHGIDHSRIREALEAYGLPLNYKQMRVPREVLIEALVKAASIRKDKRFTILREGLSKVEAKNLLTKLEII